MLKGYRTYIIALILGLVNAAVYLGWITVDQLEQINVILVALGLGALRAGVSK
jgi:hypothetical protein